MMVHYPLILALGFWGLFGQATAIPESVLRAKNLVCKDLPEVQQAGPWTHEGKTFWATLHWKEGEKEACLALFEQNRDQALVIASGNVAAGWSDRYQEAYKPILHAEPKWLHQRPPHPAIQRDSTTGGGGGGSVVVIYAAWQKNWKSIGEETLDGFTNINFMVEHNGKCTPTLTLNPPNDPDSILVERCYNGEKQTVVLHYDGNRFTETKKDAIKEP